MTKDPKANLARRNFLRALGAGAGVAAVPAALVTEAEADIGERRRQAQGALQGRLRRGEDLLPRQQLSEVREASRADQTD